MKKITVIALLSICILVPYFTKAQTNSKQLIKDFEKVSGTWTGSLTYLDYSSGKPYTMSADIEVKRNPNSNEFLFINTYPKEKSANSTQTISISQDGKYIGKEEVISRTELPDGQIEIVTQKSGTDGNDNKEAQIKQIYTIGNKSFPYAKRSVFPAIING